MRKSISYTIVDRIGILTATFTAAVTDICTSTAHGLKNGDMVVLTSTGTLPVGLATSTVYYVIEATTNTFMLSLSSCENYSTVAGIAPPVPPVNITGATTDTDTFTMHDIGRNILVEDFRHCVVSVHGYGDANIDFGFVGSIGKSPTDDGCPDFSAAAAYNNSWAYIDALGLINGTSVDGAANQVSMTGTNKHEMYELNINGLRWINILMSGWSAGNLTVVVRLFND